jgi:hypothetical protein
MPALLMLLVIDWHKVSNSELKKMPILSVRRFLSSLVGKMKMDRLMMAAELASVAPPWAMPGNDSAKIYQDYLNELAILSNVASSNPGIDVFALVSIFAAERVYTIPFAYHDSVVPFGPFGLKSAITLLFNFTCVP